MTKAPEATEFENFSYKHFDAKPLELDEAIQLAHSKNRTAAPGTRFRVVAISEDATAFTVEATSIEESIRRKQLEILEMWISILDRARHPAR